LVAGFVVKDGGGRSRRERVDATQSVIDTRVKPQASLPRLVLEKLSEMVAAGKFAVGARLPSEAELAELFGVGRSTVREAMRILEYEGVVKVRQGVGAFLVASPDKINARHHDFFADIDLVELVEARYLLEGFVAEVAAAVADREAQKELREAVQRMERDFDNLDAFYEADVLFHEALARATGNRVLYKVMSAIADSLREERERMIKTLVKVRERALRTAKEILAAVRERDRDRARAAMQEHLEDVRDALVCPRKR